DRGRTCASKPGGTAIISPVGTSARCPGDMITGVPSGFSWLDKKLSGLGRAHLIIVAARPGGGKTSFVLNVASNVAASIAKEKKDDWQDDDAPEAYEHFKRVIAFFSLEMTSDDLILRLAAARGMIPLYRLRTPKVMHDDDWRNLSPTLASIGDQHLYIDDTSDLSIHEMRSKARRLKAEKGRLDLVVVDYLQLMKAPSKVEARHLEIAEITRALKGLAKELDCPVIALSQLSRKTEERDGKPLLSHLRESGSIEQDADVVLFLSREQAKDDDAPHGETPVPMDLIIAKNRHGSTGETKMHFHGDIVRFMEITEEYEE
ncbi:MAG: hypothetical protein EBR82_58190, partial [Caulobacteraceae bacterium]|nr:hypothetical protein [Caulobacteraceae bacterium]